MMAYVATDSDAFRVPRARRDDAQCEGKGGAG